MQKILFIKNKGTKKKFYDKQKERYEYFGELKDNFGTKNLKYKITEIESDIDVSVLIKKGVTTNKVNAYTIKNLEKKMVDIIPEGYDFVYFFNKGQKFIKNGKHASYSHKKPINGAFFVEIPDCASKYNIIHESWHMFCRKLLYLGFKVVDSMDKTLVRGIWHAYYKNKYPKMKNGNHHITLMSIEPYLSHLSDKVVAKKTALQVLFEKYLKPQKKTNLYKPKNFHILRTCLKYC